MRPTGKVGKDEDKLVVTGAEWGYVGGAIGGSPLLAAPAAPTLTLVSGATDNTPGFTVDGDLVEGDTVRFQYSTSAVFSGASETTNTIDAGEDAANSLAFSTGALADGTWYFRARIERPGHINSDWSNTETETIDATAPVITSANTASVAENTTAVLTVTATDAGGFGATPFSIVGGADQAKFSIVGATGVLTFGVAPDFETPTDANTDNAYIVQVRATDAAGNATNQTITVTVTDVADVFAANAVTFDGTNDYFSGEALSGLSDSKTGTLSVWLKFAAGGDLVEQTIIASGNGRFRFYRRDDNLLIIDGFNAVGGQILGVYLSSIESTDGWVHALASWDLAAGTIQFYKTDVSGANVYTNSNDTIQYNDNTYRVCNENGAGNQKLNGDIAELWFMPGVALDLSNSANRRKFISAGGKPVSLGSDGSTPTGSAPLIFLSGATASWQTNDGTGGGFTLNGTLTTASTSPSD